MTEDFHKTFLGLSFKAKQMVEKYGWYVVAEGEMKGEEEAAKLARKKQCYLDQVLHVIETLRKAGSIYIDADRLRDIQTMIDHLNVIKEKLS